MSPLNQSHRVTSMAAAPLLEAQPDAAGNVGDAVGDAAAGTQAALRRLHSLGAAVAELAAWLDADAAALARAETPERLELMRQLPLTRLLEQPPPPLATWFDALGADLTLRLSLTGLDPDQAPVVAELRAESRASSLAVLLDAFFAAARALAATQGEVVIVEARASVGKTHALAAARELVTPDGARDERQRRDTGPIVVFYTARAWERLLTLAALPLWEQRSLISAQGPTHVLLCDAEGYLAGPALEIRGIASQHTPPAPRLSGAAQRRFAERAAEMRELCREEGAWATAPRVLTPAHLHVVAREPGLERTAAQLTRLRAALAAASLVGGVEGTFETGLTLRFGGVRPCTCVLHTLPTEPLHAKQSASGLARLAAWAYHSGSPDKLAIARECLAQALPAGGAVSLVELEGIAAEALEAAKANFAIYLRGKTEQFFKLRQAAQDAVASYGESIQKAVADLTSEVVDTVYRTVGVLLGVVIAALIQPSAALSVARLAALLYAVYLAFILSFVLRSRYDRFRLEREQLTRRLAAMRELTETERRELALSARSSEEHFRRYVARAGAVYVGLLALALLTFVLTWTPLFPALLPHLHR